MAGEQAPPGPGHAVIPSRGRWQGRTLVDHHGEPLGSIEVIYPDKIANQPEPLEVVVDPIDDRDPIDANSLLRRHVVVAVP